MYLQIKKAELQPDQYGKHIKITMIGLYEDGVVCIGCVIRNNKVTCE